MLSRRLYFRLMLATAGLLALLGAVPRLVNTQYLDVLDAGLQLAFSFGTVAALAGLNYAFTTHWGLPGVTPKRNWRRPLLRLGANMVLAAGLATVLGRLHAALLPGLPRTGLLTGYQIRAQLDALVVALVQFSSDQFEQARRVGLENERLLREQLLARYEVLKQQVSPHFLFNSLTTLGWLIRDQPAAAERFVEEMSRVYRYVLQHGEHNQVPLAEEVAFTKSYVYLLHMRFGDSLHLHLDLPAWVLPLPVPPLALQTLVENAVKHNVVSQDRPLSIHIFLAEPNLLTVQNTRQPRLTPEPSSGVGLRNLANRLRFLYDQELTIDQDESTFTVQLPLPHPYAVKP